MPMLPEPQPLMMLPMSNPAASPEPPQAVAAEVNSPPRSLLEQAAELANQGRYPEAIAACEQHLRQKGPGRRRIT